MVKAAVTGHGQSGQSNFDRPVIVKVVKVTLTGVCQGGPCNLDRRWSKSDWSKSRGPWCVEYYQYQYQYHVKFGINFNIDIGLIFGLIVVVVVVNLSHAGGGVCVDSSPGHP